MNRRIQKILIRIPAYRNYLQAKEEAERRLRFKRAAQLIRFTKALARFEKRCRDRETIVRAAQKRYRKMRNILEMSGMVKPHREVGIVIDFQDMKPELPEKYQGKFRPVYLSYGFSEDKKSGMIEMKA